MPNKTRVLNIDNHFKLSLCIHGNLSITEDTLNEFQNEILLPFQMVLKIFFKSKESRYSSRNKYLSIQVQVITIISLTQKTNFHSIYLEVEL